MGSQSVHTTINRAEEEIGAGRLWRAKEILRGSLASGSFALEPDFLEAYGALLERLGDRYEAGKYLFLSGHRTAEYEEAITLYLERNRRTDINDLIAQIPAAIRHRGLGNLPSPVLDYLEQRGANESELRRCEPLPNRAEEPAWKVRAKLAIAIGSFFGFVIATVVLAAIGAVTALQWIR